MEFLGAAFQAGPYYFEPSSFALLPFLFWFFQAYPLRPENGWRRLPLYSLASVLFGPTRTTLMYTVRTPLYHWLGLDSYSPRPSTDAVPSPNPNFSSR